MPLNKTLLPLITALTLVACNDEPQPALPPSTPVKGADMSVTDQGQTTDQGMADQGVDMRADQGRDMTTIDMPQDMPLDQDAATDMAPVQGSLTVTVVDDQIQLSWTTPPQAARPTLRLLRRAGSPVSDAQDPNADILTEGTATSFAHPTRELDPEPERYHYALFACNAQDCAQAAPPAELSLSLTQALRGGGYNIIWRHASASTCSDNTALGSAATTTQPDWWRSCESTCNIATARQLTDPAATTEMMQVNAYMRGRQIPFSRVLSSEFCRCFQTADGFDLGPTTELLRELTFFVYDEPQRCANSLALLNTPPAGATNVAMVGHAGFTCPTLGSLAWGEAAIYKPDLAQVEPKLIRRLRADQWSQLP